MKNKLGDRCFADTMNVELIKGKQPKLIAEVDGILFESTEYLNYQAWLQAIVYRVQDCALGKLS